MLMAEYMLKIRSTLMGEKSGSTKVLDLFRLGFVHSCIGFFRSSISSGCTVHPAVMLFITVMA